MTFSSLDDIIKSTHAIDAKGGRLPIGIPGRLQIGMHGRLRRCMAGFVGTRNQSKRQAFKLSNKNAGFYWWSCPLFGRTKMPQNCEHCDLPKWLGDRPWSTPEVRRIIQ